MIKLAHSWVIVDSSFPARGVWNVKKASNFSLLVFAPVLSLYLLPALFLLPGGVLMVLIAIFDPMVPLSDAFSINMWVIGPLLAALGLFLAGIGLHGLHQRGRSSRTAGMTTWAIFSAALFTAFWYGFTVLGSVGASDKPIHIYLRTTALFAAGLTVLAQGLVIPWLLVILKALRGSDTINGTRTGDAVQFRPEKPAA